MLSRAVAPAARICGLLAMLGSGACWQDRDTASDATPSPQEDDSRGPGEGALPCDPNDGVCADEAAPRSCDEPVVVYRDGARAGELCDPAAEGLTVVDLGDAFAPRVLQGGGDFGPVPYRERYLAVAREQFGDDDTWYRYRSDRYHELYGVFPTPLTVASRLADEARHQCHDRVSGGALEALQEGVDTWQPLLEQKSDHAWRKSLLAKLEGIQKALRLGSVDDLANHPLMGPYHRQWRLLSLRHDAIAEAQRHFRCDGLLDDKAERDGLLDTRTIEALQTYLRRHMVITWQLDDEAKRILSTDSRELDFRQLLRSLRERVVDATALVEDGTAIGQHGEVVGRIIDTATLVHEHDGVVLEGGAPDLIAQATDAAARHLGWTSPEAALSFFASGEAPARVALPLPGPPAYHGDNMDVVVRIDRGDVWFDFPFVPGGDRQLQPRNRKPTLVLYAKDGDREIPLVRWPTTIGGWQPEHVGDSVKLAYKESPEGHFIYRDIIAAPSWIPPDSTPTRDLMRPAGNGWAPKYDTMGPSYASAYGMAMMIHLRVDAEPDGSTVLTDGGVRTHGSVSYGSIMDGFSHGCHRLHNHRAVRLADFFLAHRPYQVRGPLVLDHHKALFFRTRRHTLHFDSRGYRYELTPPVDVEVLRGNVRGYAQRPLPPRPLTRPMLKRYE